MKLAAPAHPASGQTSRFVRMLSGAAADESHGRRSKRRVAYRVPCQLIVPIDARQRITVAGETLNASADGIAVQVGLPLARGAAVEVVVPSAPTRVCGQVVHSRRVATGTYLVGIRLVDPLPPD